MEFLVQWKDTIIPQYFDDVLCWAAGARTSESQIHRELASGISTQDLKIILKEILMKLLTQYNQLIISTVF